MRSMVDQGTGANIRTTKRASSFDHVGLSMRKYLCHGNSIINELVIVIVAPVLEQFSRFELLTTILSLLSSSQYSPRYQVISGNRT